MAWRRYQNANNRYQSANVAAGLSCQRDADMGVTDAAARVRGEWRHAVAMSNVDTEPLSEYEQPLPIRERDAGIVTARQERHGHGGVDASGAASRRRTLRSGHNATPIHEQSLSNHKNVTAACRDRV